MRWKGIVIRMNILVMTPLYYIDGRSDLVHDTSAIHYLLKNISVSHNIIVINTYEHERHRIFRLLNKKYRTFYFSDYFFEKDGIKVYLIENQKITTNRLVGFNCKKIIKHTQRILYNERFSPDVVVVHFPGKAVGYIDNIAKGVKKVAILHESDVTLIEMMPKILDEIQLQYSHFFARSKKIRDKFDELGLSNLSTEIVYSGAPTTNCKVKDRHFWSEFRKRPITILYAGKLIERKHIDWIIECLSRMNDPRLQFRIIGNGEQRTFLEQTIIDYDLKKQVTLLPEMSRSNVINEMVNADIFCMPSTGETFGLVYLEAMACGCITIGTKHEGIDGVIRDGENGLLISGREELCSCLQHIIYDMTIDELVDMSSKAIDTGKDFSEENMSKRYFDLITQ